MRSMTLIVAIAAALLLSQPPATTQRPHDPRVQVWLERAERDVRAVVAQPMPNPLKHFGTKIDLALVLVQTRGNEADRKLLREAMAQPMPPPRAKEAPELRELALHY